MSELVTAIENVYLAFSDVPKPDAIGACPCCIDDATLDRLVAVPLRQVSGDDLSPYASSAFLTAGDVDDYEYFLPRILEISLADDLWWPDVAITGRAMSSAKIATGSERRVSSVQELFEAALASFISEQDFDRIDDWVCGAAKAGLNVNRLLKVIENDDTAILAFFDSNAGALAKGKLGNAFWESYDPGQETILEWLMSENIRRVPYEAYGYKSF